MKDLSKESLQRLSQLISAIKKNKKINKDVKFDNLSKYDTTYYPIRSQYILGKGCFIEGCFPREIMYEDEIIEHFLRKSAVKYFLDNTRHTIVTLSNCLEIPMEKLITLDCLTEEEISTLDMLRIIWEEEIQGQMFNTFIGENFDKAIL